VQYPVPITHCESPADIGTADSRQCGSPLAPDGGIICGGCSWPLALLSFGRLL